MRDPCYTEKVDCWSMGVIFFIMLSGGLPFYEDEHGTVEHKVRHNMYVMRAALAHPLHRHDLARERHRLLLHSYAFEADEWHDVSETARDFIKKILVRC